MPDRVSDRIDVGGWINAGFMLNSNGNRSGTGNAPLPLNDVSDTPVLNQLWVFAQKDMDLDRNEFDWGYRVDYVFGTDAPDNQAAGDQGWDFGWNSSRDYGSAIPLIFGEIGFQNVAMKVGYFNGLQGYESNQAPQNFFYSVNYAYGYGTPGTHSGVLFTVTPWSNVEITAGWANGWDSWWSNYLNASTLIGGVSWTINNEASLTYHMTFGDFGDGTARNGDASNNGAIYAHAIIFEYSITDRWDYAFEHTLGNNFNLGRGNNQWYSIANYMFYDITDTLAIGGRIEWFSDPQGKRVDTNGSGPGDFYEATVGLNFEPIENVRIRPELRCDWFDGTGRPFDSRNGGMNGNSRFQMTGGLDVLVIF